MPQKAVDVLEPRCGIEVMACAAPKEVRAIEYCVRGVSIKPARRKKRLIHWTHQVCGLFMSKGGDWQAIGGNWDSVPVCTFSLTTPEGCSADL